MNSTLDHWMPRSNLSYTSGILFEDFHADEHYEMPRKLDWNLFRKIYDIQPRNYEQLISIPGFGPAAVKSFISYWRNNLWNESFTGKIL